MSKNDQMRLFHVTMLANTNGVENPQDFPSTQT